MKNYFSRIPFILLPILFFSVTVLIDSCSDNNSTSPDNTELIKQIENITFYTENYPPFNYEQDGNVYGVSIDILEELFIKMNVELDRAIISINEWNVVYQATLETKNTMLFSTVRSDERENLFKWVGPIAPHKDVIISLAAGNVTVNNSNDLLNYRIGVIRDYSSIQLLLSYGINESGLTIVDNAGDLYSMLVNGTVDCIAYSEIGHGLMQSVLALNEADFKIQFVMKVSELYYAFNNNTFGDIINYFQNALDELKDDRTSDGSGVYDKIISNYNIINHSNDGITSEQVINLVEQTSSGITENAAGTFTKINNSEHPYKDRDFPALYAFVYDTSLTMVAHAANSLIVGANFKGKPDVSGKKFRDEILAGALSGGTGWEDYIYTKPGEGGLYYKTTYYKLTPGSNGKLYVVCAGKYK
jgi:polar amino acid transport system substrate-binding protein